MHYAKVERSVRLQRVLEVLLDYQPHTTRDIIRKAHVCAVNSIIAELRLNRFHIDCIMITKGRFEYQLKRRNRK